MELFPLIAAHITDMADLGRLACTCRLARDTLRDLLELTQHRRRACALLMKDLGFTPYHFWRDGSMLWRRSAYISSRGRLVISERAGWEGRYTNLSIITPKPHPLVTRGYIMHFITMPSHTAHVTHRYKNKEELLAYLGKHTMLRLEHNKSDCMKLPRAT